MGRFAKLSYTSSPKMQQYVGCVGELEKNVKGGYDFRMLDNGLTISTSGVHSSAFFGGTGSCQAQNISFQTQSGSEYQFDFIERERDVDDARRDEKQVVRPEQTYKRGDEVYTDKGHKGIVLRHIPTADLYIVRDVVSQVISTYSPTQLKPVCFSQRLEDAKAEANSHNAQVGSAKQESHLEYGK